MNALRSRLLRRSDWSAQRSTEAGSRSLGRRSRLLLVGCCIVLLCSVAAQAGVTEGEAVFNKKCQACHKLPDPDSPPVAGWPTTLKKMARFAGLKSNQRADVLAFLQSHNKAATQTVALAEDRALFEQKCSHCHTPERVFLTMPDNTTLRHIVERMRSFQSDWISEVDAERIVNYIALAVASKQTELVDVILTQPESASEVFAQRCTGCHTLERIFLKLEKEGQVDWNHVVARMERKAPEWIDSEEAELILAFLESLTPPPEDLRGPATSGD